MSAIPQVEETTVTQIWNGWEKSRESYDSIGISMSMLGNECDRELWNAFRWVSEPESHDGQRLRLFETGNIEETRMIADLRRIPGVTVYDTDPDRKGKQWKVYSHGGHVRGKLDGKVIGLPENPTVLHVLECKSHNEKNFKALVKNGVKKSKPAHWWQCQKYMSLTGIHVCLYLAVNKNDDALYPEFVTYDAEAVAEMDARLTNVITSDRPPARIGENPAKWPCLLCKQNDVCHGLKFARRNCRTCIHSSAVIIEGSTEAKWTCVKFNKWLPLDRQKVGCESHLYLPDLVAGEQVDADPDGNWIEYEMKSGKRWRNEVGVAQGDDTGEKPPVVRYWWTGKVLFTTEDDGSPANDPEIEELTEEEFAEAKAFFEGQADAR